MAVIKADSISLGYQEKIVVKDISLEIDKGDFVALVGPNGSGKSTLLKAICGNLQPAKGTVWVEEKVVEEYSAGELALKVAWLPQNPVIPEGVSVEEFVGYGRFPHRNWRGMSSAKDREIVTRSIESVGLNSLKERFLTRLSGGELQRARIAMVMAQEAEIVVFDEPTTFLDIAHQYEILNQIKELNQNLGITVVMVVHDLNQAASFARRIIVLDNGGIYRDGSAEEVITEDTLREVFGVKSRIMKSPFYVIVEGV